MNSPADLSLDRRSLLAIVAALAAAGVPSPGVATPAPVRLLLIHGRSQQGHDPADLKKAWLAALRRGAQAAGVTLPEDVDVAFPFYGDVLDKFARAYDIPLASDIKAKGNADTDEYLAFQAEIAEALRQRAGVTDAQIDAEYGPNPRAKGPLNWDWVQAILRALDKNGGGLGQQALAMFTRDVFLYTTRDGVRDEIDDIVAGSLTVNPTVIVAHSLGSVVAYNVLRTDKRDLKVPLLVTVGCPLGIRAIRRQYQPLRFPKNVGGWYNAYDRRDVVALYALDRENFPVPPPPEIVNYALVDNHTDNRHGIDGYLDDPAVAKRVIGALA
ncbi:hypothetical protein NML43_20540 [Rhodopseudomonas palustris]|uniref:hypothetical protein n=1 Tax=Rhodopseudomonas palustris TaxID=1076 RepID=UPI0020CC25CF|nr:hypothetical protein [Rhodopseudomonas palustris]MCP9629485.1 hypothetical protein [Rhodopseudomonas palustris]